MTVTSYTEVMHEAWFGECAIHVAIIDFEWIYRSTSSLYFCRSNYAIIQPSTINKIKLRLEFHHRDERGVYKYDESMINIYEVIRVSDLSPDTFYS